jgi:hypothetical protein
LQHAPPEQQSPAANAPMVNVSIKAMLIKAEVILFMTVFS